MALNLDLATGVFRLLFPDFVDSVQRVLFEHAVSGRDRADPRWLMDRSAVDFAVLCTKDGERGVIYGEIKLTENMAAGPAAKMRDRYGQASKQVRLYRDPDSATLRSVINEQLWREHMLAKLAVDNGVTSRALFTAVAPELNRSAQSAFKIYQAELLDADQREPDRAAFVPLTLETFIRAIAQAGACELAQALWERYCDLGRVVRLAVQEITGDEALSPETRLRADTSATIKPPLPPVRRRSRSSSRSRTDMASSSSEVVAKVTTGQEAI
jgi:hypothetical protein